MMRDKRLVAQAFSRAASSYDSVAGLQRAVADELLEWLPIDDAPMRVLDLGSGTGYASAPLNARYPQAHLLGVDLAEGMLRFARQQNILAGQHFVCGDAEALPLASASIDLIFSSLAIQWCEAPAQLFREVARVLKPGGRFLVSTLGPQTLLELKRAWSQVDDDVHVNEFTALERLLDQVGALTLQRQETKIKRLEYDRLGQLMHELKALGAHNVNSRRQRGLSGPARLRALTRAYETMRLDNGRLPASYEIYFLELSK